MDNLRHICVSAGDLKVFLEEDVTGIHSFTRAGESSNPRHKSSFFWKRFFSHSKVRPGKVNKAIMRREREKKNRIPRKLCIQTSSGLNLTCETVDVICVFLRMLCVFFGSVMCVSENQLLLPSLETEQTTCPTYQFFPLHNAGP